MKNFFLLFAFLLLGELCFAQNNLAVEYRNTNSVPNLLNICGDPDNAVVVVKTQGVSASARTSIIANIKLFKGVEFIALDNANTTPGVSIVNITNRNQPVLSLPNIDPNVGGGQIQIGFTIAANCGYVDSISQNNLAAVYDTWSFNYNMGSQMGLSETDQTEEYRTAFKVPNFTIALDQNISPAARVGDCYSRTLTMANSALEGFVDTVIYTNKQGAGVSIKKLYIGGIEIPFTKTAMGTDTLIRAYIWGQWLQTASIGSAPGNGDVFLDPDERISIKEDICIVNCTKSRTSVHTVGWGCKGQVCNAASVSGFARIGEGQPNALITSDGNPGSVKIGYCQPGKLVVRYKNTGSEVDAGFGTMKDVELQIGMGNILAMQNDFFKTISMSVAGINISPLANLIAIKDNPLFAVDPDGPGGLSDEDGDGFFDDLKVNQTVELILNYEYDCTNAMLPGADSTCLNEFNVAWNAHIRYTDPCNARITKSLPNFGASQNTNEEYINCIDPDTYANDTFYVQHIETRGVRNFEKSCGGQEYLQIWVKLPAGVQAVLSKFGIYKNNGTTSIPILGSSMSGDTLFVRFDATNPFINGKYDIRMAFIPNCNTAPGRIILPFAFEHVCPPCDCKHTWYCANLHGPKFHPTVPPCTSGITCPVGVQTTSFDVARSTYGFTTPSYTTRVNPNNINTNVAIHCDSVRMTACSVVGLTPLSDSIGLVIRYDNVEYLKDTTQLFLFGKGTVRINHGGQIINCAITPANLTVEKGDTTKILTFSFNDCLVGSGITLQPGDSIKFYGDFLVNPKGPMIDNFRKVPNLRAYGFATIDGTDYACDDFGENFFVAKIPTTFATPGGSEFPRGCSSSPFQYRLITKNIGFSNQYVNEYYPAIKVDSLVLNYDPALLDVFQNLKVEVSFPGHPVYGNTFYTIHPLQASDNGHYVAKFDTLNRVPSYNGVQSYSFNLRISVTPGCESLFGSALANNQYKMDPTIYFTDRYFATWFGDGSCADKKVDARTQKLTYTDPPTVSFQPVSNPNHLLAADTAEWIIKQCNTSTKSDAGATWLAAQYDPTQLEIIGFQMIDNPAAPVDLALVNYGSGKLFAVTPGVKKQASPNGPTDICNTIKVKALVRQCGTFPVKLSMGWNCAPYSDPNWNPDLYEPCSYDSLELTVTTLDPSIDATVYNQPLEFPSPCDTIALELLVRNTGQGTAFGIDSKFSVPLTGAELVPGGVEIAYPSNAAYQPALGDPEFLENTTRGKYYIYHGFTNLNTYLTDNGLAGFDVNAPNPSNEFKIRYKFTVGCDFVSGAQSFYSFKGNKVCGLPTNEEGGETLPILFTGITPPPDKLFDVGLTAGSLLANADTSSLEIFVKNLTPTPTSSSDKVQIKLPSGVAYVPSSSTGVVPAGWSAQEPTVAQFGDILVLTWDLPVGVTLNDSIRLKFKVISPQISCSGVLEASISTINVQQLVCPGAQQGCEIGVITTDNGEHFIAISAGESGDFAGPDQQICAGGSVSIDASQNNFVSYSWAPTSNVSDPNIANPVITPDETTTYTVTALDASGCTFIDEVVVTVSNNLVVNAFPTPATCGVSNGAIMFTVDGGSGSYAFQWDPAVSSTAEASGLAAGGYDVTVTDLGNGCTATSAVMVGNSGTSLSLNLSSTPSNTVDLFSGTIQATISGGTAPYSVQWMGPVAGNDSNVSSSPHAIGGLSAGLYTVVVTDQSGCSAENTVFVAQDVINNLNLVASASPDTSCCFAKGEIHLAISGGDGDYSILWNPPSGVLADQGFGAFDITDVAPGVYEITVTDGLGLSTTGTVTVADACNCSDIFGTEILIEPSGVEGICIPIPFAYIDEYPIFINGEPYTGPYIGCELDTIVNYAFSFLNGNGYNGPYLLTEWYIAGQVVAQDVLFENLYDLVDSMNIWDPAGAWILDDLNSLIVGGDLFEQEMYGHMNIIHMPTWSPYTVQTNYNGFAYGTEIFVDPFDKVILTVYDSLACCTDTLCIQFVNPCETLVPQEPYTVTTEDPNVCLPIPYDHLSDYFVFVDRFPGTIPMLCSGGGTSFYVPGPIGAHEVIVIDTTQWCADTVLVYLVNKPVTDIIPLTTNEGVPIVGICLDTTELLGNTITVTPCISPNSTVVVDSAFCFTYVPNPAFFGIDTFCMQVCDETGTCDTTIFVVTVLPSDLTPIVKDTIYITTPFETQANGICVDPSEMPGTQLTLSGCGLPANGTIQIPAAGLCVSYLPADGFSGTDSFCVLLCDETGSCDTTIIIVTVLPGNPPPPVITTDTVYITTTFETPSDVLCIPTDQLVNPVVNSFICGLPSDGMFTQLSDSCLTYTPDNQFSGNDSGCIILCDAAGNCDTTIIVITVLPNNPPPTVHVDTLYLSTPINTPITGICLDATELTGPVVSLTYCGLPTNGVFNTTGTSCIEYVPQTDYVGLDGGCVILCDGSGVCDTTILIIMVETPDSNNVYPNVDTLYLSTPVNTLLENICLDLSELTTGVANIGLCGSPANGDLTVSGPSCLEYQPNAGFVGLNYACVYACDSAGVCDTTYLVIMVTPQDTMVNPPSSPSPDTLYITTTQETTSDIVCIPTDELAGAIVSSSFCGLPTNGLFTQLSDSCLFYTPNNLFTGTDQGCIILCDAAGVCDTTYIVITVLPINPPPVVHVDTLYLSTPINTPITGICLDATELTGPVVSLTYCGLPTNGVFNTTGTSCIEYVPQTDYVGLDGGCVILCDGSGVCDTTILIILVETPDSNNVYPNVDTLYLSTPVNTLLENICLDLSELTTGVANIGLCGSPANGDLTVSGPSCLEYQPNAGFVGLNYACVYACDSAGVCDTTYLVIMVTPQDTMVNPPSSPSPDTLYITTTQETTSDIVCIPTDELAGAIVSSSFCGLPTNGLFTQLSDSCLFYTPNNLFTGTDQGCIILCDAAGVCDTTYIVITVLPINPPPVVHLDTLYLSTPINTPITGICLDTTELTGPVVSLTYCGLPTNGVFNTTGTSCIEYVPQTDYVGLDGGCVILCDGSGVCDTTILIILVETPDSNNVYPNVDTLYLSTPVNTLLDSICLDLSQLSTGVASFGICGNTANGDLQLLGASCLTYQPDSNYIGLDYGCVYVCDSAGVCDTTYLVILVTPEDSLAQGDIEPDTIYVTTPYFTVSDTFCIPTIDLAYPIASVTFCGLPANGLLTQISDTCLTYTPDSLFVGTDAACIILCDTSGACDTTIIIFTVLPPADCDYFDVDSVTVEVSPTAQFGEVCLSNITFTDVLGTSWFDNANAYANGFLGCNFDSCFAYTYFTVPDFGQTGPYRLDYWYVGGDTLTMPFFNNIDQLVDSMQVWDPAGGWAVDPSTLTIRTCSGTWNNYGDMKITQYSSGGIAEIQININLMPENIAIQVTPGEHLVTVFGPNCIDSLWVNVVVSNQIVIDTFTYLNSGRDTICLGDLGINTAGLSVVQTLCPNGTDVEFSYDETTHCLMYEGIQVGVDTFCLKLAYGNDSCLYFTVYVTVLEDIPCSNFIVPGLLTATSADCGVISASVCLDIPNVLINEFVITDNGVVTTPTVCAPNPAGINQTQVTFTSVGLHTVIFNRVAAGCLDTISVIVSCLGDNNTLYDTIYQGNSDTLCLDTAALLGNAVSLTNICPDQSGQYVNFVIDPVTYCISYTGLDAPGTEVGCFVLCDDLGICDTVYLQVTVLPDSAQTDSLLPVARPDVDTLLFVNEVWIPVLENDSINGTLVEIQIITPPVHGVAEIQGNNAITYSPDDFYCNTIPDSFQYVICNQYGCDSAWVHVYVPCTDIKIYNGFSPNGDGFNDTFTIEGIEFHPDNELAIYDRWGLRVLKQSAYRNEWTGTWNGKDLPDGVYFYIFRVTIDEVTKEYKGYLVILR